MRGYDSSSYGDAFADVYDDWYQNVTDVAATVEFLTELGDDGPFLELGVGTGRLAVPLAARGARVIGIDSSEAMVARLCAKEGGDRVEVVVGDMSHDLPIGPFRVVFVAYNTIFGLQSADEQANLFRRVAEVLRPGGHFVVEAFVPDVDRPAGDNVSVRTLDADRVVLGADRHDPRAQTIDGQLIEITERFGVRLRPFRIRYSTPAQLDEMARASGLELVARHEDVARREFDGESPTHVSVYSRR